MGVTLFPHQVDLVSKTYEAWSRVDNVLAVLPTGGGKTYTLSYIVNDARKARNLSIIFAHRDHLCEQLSMSLATMGIHHGFICSNSTRTHITNMHYEEFGESFYDDSADPLVLVASVDTFVAQLKKGTIQYDISKCKLAVVDEAHHVLGGDWCNKWGKCVYALPEGIKVLGVTATPERADKKGLGIDAHGIFEEMIVGVSMKWLIDNGYLSSYRIIAPPGASSVRMAAKKARVAASGDFSIQVAESLVDTATITGDVVQTYLKHARGKQGITFCASVEHAERLAHAYRAAGVTAEAVSSYTKPAERKRIVNEFRKGNIMQLCNMQLFDEGFDVPGVVCVSFVRPTMSYGLFVQQFGRALRMLKGKKEAFIFDHVDNVREHKLPDHGREWSLDAPVRRKKNTESEFSLKTCGNIDCQELYELPAPCCPKCGWHPTPSEIREYKEVDGDLVELTEADLAELRGELGKVNLDNDTFAEWAYQNAPNEFAAVNMVKQHKNIQDKQHELRISLHNWWVINNMGDVPDADSQFSMLFGMSVTEAMTLKTKDAEKLKYRVDNILSIT